MEPLDSNFRISDHFIFTILIKENLSDNARISMKRLAIIMAFHEIKQNEVK